MSWPSGFVVRVSGSGFRIQEKVGMRGKLPVLGRNEIRESTLEATQGQIDGFFSQFPYKCYLFEVGLV